MTQLLEIREWIKRFYCKNEQYILPVIKFTLGAIMFAVINIRMGYMDSIAKFPVVLILALLCSFLPFGFIVLLTAVMVILHLYTLGIECAVIVGIVFLLMFLLYFRFSPKDAIVVLITPLMFVFKIPYAIPLFMGFVGNPFSVVSVSCGVISYYVLYYINTTASSLSKGSLEEVSVNFKSIIDGIVGNKEMFVTIVAFAATILVIYTVRRLNVDKAWTIALIVGALTDILIIFVGDLIFTTNISVLLTLLGTLIGALIVKVIQFFIFNLDYSRTEKVQFEDDEYYYFVKAVPKVCLADANKKRRIVSNQDTIDGPASDRAQKQVRKAIRKD